MADSTSIGSVQLDLEVKPELDKSTQEQVKQVADRVKKMLSGMNMDMFKGLTQGFEDAMNHMTNTIKEQTDLSKQIMKSFVDEMSAMKMNISSVHLDNDSVINGKSDTTSASSNKTRGSPSMIKMPKMDMSAELAEKQVNHLKTQIDYLTLTISNSKKKMTEYRQHMESFVDAGDTFRGMQEELVSNEKALTDLNLKIAELKQHMSSLSTLKEKIAVNNEIKELSLQAHTVSSDIEYLKSKLEGLGKVNAYEAILKLDEKMMKLESTISHNELKIDQYKAKLKSLNTISPNNDIAVPQFPEIASPLSQLKGMGSFSKLGTLLSGAFKMISPEILEATAAITQFASVFKSKMSAVNSAVKGVVRSISKMSQSLVMLAKIGINPLSSLKKMFDKLRGSANGASRSTRGYGMSIGRLVQSFTIFSLIFPLVSRCIMALGSSIKSALLTNQQFSNSCNQIKTNLMAAFMPIYQAILPALNALMSALAKVTAMFAGFISALFGKTYTQSVQAAQGLVDMKDAMGAYGNSAKKAAKDAQNALMGFDEINKLQSDDGSNDSGGGSSSGKVPTIVPTDFDEGAVNEFAKKIKDMFNKGDFTGIGKLIGEKINQGVLTFTKYISWSNVGKKITEVVMHITDLFNSLVNTIDWENIGRLLGAGINTIANTLYLLMTGMDWSSIGKAFANGLNGSVYSVEWDKLGRTIGSYLQAKISGLYGFVTTADWPAIGKALADGCMGIVNEVDWNQLAELMGKGITGAVSGIHNFVNNIDWRMLGTKIGTSINTFFSNVNWADLGATLSDAARGLLETLRSALSNIDWSLIGKALADFLCNIDWVGLLIDLAVVIGQAFIGLTGTIVEFIKELAGNIITGFFNGLIEFFGDPIGWIREHIVDPFINAIKDLFGIHSPSTVLADIGRFLIEGLINGIGGMVGTLISNVGEWFGGIGDAIGNTWDSIKEGAGTAWENITSTIGNSWDNLKQGAADTWENLKTGVTSTWENIKQGAGYAWDNISSGIGGFVGDIKNNISNGFNSAKQFAIEQSGNLKNGVISAFDNMKSSLGKLPGQLKNTASDMFNKMRDGVNSTIGNVKNAVKSGMDGAVSTIKSVSKQASTWGSDMIDGMASGIRNAASNIGNAVSGIANNIKSWLHFSRPDEGPLREYETWMPDMIDGLSRTLTRSAPKLISNVSEMAKSISVAMVMDTPDIAFAGHQELTYHQVLESDDDTKSEMIKLVTEIRNLHSKFDEIRQAIIDKNTDIVLDGMSIKDNTVKLINNNTRKNGVCEIDF